MNSKFFSRLSLLLFFLVIIVNYLTASGTIPGLAPQKEVSSLYDTPITPAGFAFSIWGVIYALLFAAIIYMIRISSENSPRSGIVNQMIPPLFFLFGFNVLWNLAFGMEWIGISLILIIGYWISLIAAGLRLAKAGSGQNPVLPLAFGVHTGWITIAGIVNLYAFLVKIKWALLLDNPEFWTVAGIAATVVLAALLQVLLKNPVLPLGTAWALFGIYMKGLTYTRYPYIPGLLLAGIGLLLVFAVITFVKNNKALLPR